MQLNILLTVHQFLPHYFSGTEILTFSVAKELIRRGHRVSVLTGFPARNDLPDHLRFDEYNIEGIDIYRFHHAYVTMGGQDFTAETEYNNQFAGRYFARILERIRPDVVHFFHFSRLGIGLVDVAAAAGVPTYYTPTDFWSVCRTSQLMLTDGRMCGGPSGYSGNCVKHLAELTRGPRAARIAKSVPIAVADAFVKLTVDGILPRYPNSRDVAATGQRKNFNVSRLNALHGIVSPTQLMTDMLTANGVDARLITQSAYGINTAGYGKRVRKIPESGVVNFGFIGTLQPHKGCHVLIEAFRQLERGRAKLRVYGNTTDSPHYFDMLQRNSAEVNFIEFCGTFSNDRITEVLDSLDVLVVPSIWYENAPLVIYSALAARCPIIASDFPGMSEVVRDGFNGLTFRPGDVQALREKLDALINDSALLELLSTNCSPPKSTAEYVDGLLTLYAGRDSAVPGRGEIAGRQTINPLGDYDDMRGYICGWGIAGFDQPSRVSILEDGELRGQTDEFLPRPDVRDGLRALGERVKAERLGFIVTFPQDTQRDKAILQMTAKDGRLIRLPLGGIGCGKMLHLSKGDFLGLDSDSFETDGETVDVGENESA